jgi:Est1 DNA/RNA binding domain
MLEEVIMDRAVTAKFLNRFTFINLSALYVSNQPNIPQFLATVLDQYTLLLRLLSTELENTPQSTDPTSYITPIVRRTTPCLRLYSKWLILHHSEVPKTFWTQYIRTSNSLSKIWQQKNPPKLSYPLEEDLAAAGFAPLETPEDSRKRKHKRDRARNGNRKKGFDKLLLQWGRTGGDSSVSTSRDDHPNVEMTLRLADLLSDAFEIASIPVYSLDNWLT